MSHRYDTSLIPGAHVYGVGSLGVLGSAIPSTGEHGPGYAYNDLTFPADNDKEICGRITTWPTNGTLFAYEDTSFDYTALSDGADSFAYQLYVDGVAVGSPTTVTLITGIANGSASGSLASIALSAPTATAAGTSAGAGLASGALAAMTLSAPTATATAGVLTDSEKLDLILQLLAAQPTVEQIAAEVLNILNLAIIPVNTVRINDGVVVGDGTAGNDWRGLNVPPQPI